MSGEVNIPLLRKAVEWAEVEAAKPEIDREWRQDNWLSRPTLIAEDLLDETPLEDGSEAQYRSAVEQVATHCGTAYCIAGWVGQATDQRYAESTEVGGLHVQDFARDVLGLSFYEAGALFECDNTIEDVRRIAESIAGERL